MVALQEVVDLLLHAGVLGGELGRGVMCGRAMLPAGFL